MAKKPLTQATYAVNNIQNEADQVKGEAARLKAAFDQTGADAKTHTNNTLLVELQAETPNATGANAIGSEAIMDIGIDNVGDELKSAKTQIDDKYDKTEVYSKTELGSVTDGDSGADKIGMTPIAETGASNRVQSVIEALITRIKSITDGSSGADLVGATTITGIVGNTVQTILENLKTYIDSQAPLNIPDDSITNQKMAPGNKISNKNYLINGNFQVNQRVVSGTVVLAAGEYGHDRFKGGSSGCTYIFATSNGITTLTITAGSLIQVIESSSLVSDDYTLSWDGTAQGKIGAGSYADSPITASVTGGSNLSIEFDDGTLSLAKFELGDKSTPFVPKTYAEELRDCQRYYEVLDYTDTTQFIGAELTFYDSITTGVVSGIKMAVPKRTDAPTVTVTGLKYRRVGVRNDITVTTVYVISTSVTIRGTVATARTIGDSYPCESTSSTLITIDDEL